MRAAARVVGMGILLGGWGVLVRPALLDALAQSRMEAAAPLNEDVIKRKIGLLPQSAQQTEPVRQLQEAMRQTSLLHQVGERWSQGLAEQIPPDLREKGAQTIDFSAPPPPLTPEAAGTTGEVLSLAQALIQNYGYQPVPARKVYTNKPWTADRRTRALVAAELANTHQLSDSQAAALLHLTLDLLEAQLKERDRQDQIRELFPVVMGEKAAF